MQTDSSYKDIFNSVTVKLQNTCYSLCVLTHWPSENMLKHLKGSCYQRFKQVSSLYTNVWKNEYQKGQVTKGDRTKLELMIVQLIFSPIWFLPALPLPTYPITVQVTQLYHLYTHYTIYLWKYKSALGLGSDGEGVMFASKTSPFSF